MARDVFAALREIEPADATVTVEMVDIELALAELVAKYRADVLDAVDAQQVAALYLGEAAECTDATVEELDEPAVSGECRARPTAPSASSRSWSRSPWPGRTRLRHRCRPAPARAHRRRSRIADDAAAARRDTGPPFAPELEVDGPPTPIVLDPAQRWAVEDTMTDARPLDESTLVGLDLHAEFRHGATGAARADAPGLVLTTKISDEEVGDVVAYATKFMPVCWLVDLHVRTFGPYESDALRKD